MFDRPDSGERAVLVHLTFHSGQEDLLELKELAKSAGTDPVYVVTGSRKRPDPKYFVGKGKLDELKTGLSRDHIDFNYAFNENLHDRWIETDTGWRIILGRGLDIFQKPDDKFTLGFLDQTKRKCKATTINYTRLKEAV